MYKRTVKEKPSHFSYLRLPSRIGVKPLPAPQGRKPTDGSLPNEEEEGAGMHIGKNGCQ